MADPLINSNSNTAQLPYDHCTSTTEVDQAGIPPIGTGASEILDPERSLALNQEATSLPSLGASAPEVMSISELTSYCIKEILLYQKGVLQQEMYCIELLRRAMLQGKQDAWKSVQKLLSETVRGWISEYPRKEEACDLESEETYVDRAFARFYLLSVSQQREFSQLSAALQYLKVCLSGVILWKLRACSRTRAFPLPTFGDTGESTVVHATDNDIVWNILCRLCKSVREQRLAYLLFQCGLQPRDIVNYYPQEFHDLREIVRVRYTILEQLLQHVNCLDDWREDVKEVDVTTGKGLDGEREK